MRLIPHSPPAFDGTLTALFESHILTVLPDVEEVEHVHRCLVDYIDQAATMNPPTWMTGIPRETHRK